MSKCCFLSPYLFYLEQLYFGSGLIILMCHFDAASFLCKFRWDLHGSILDQMHNFGPLKTSRANPQIIEPGNSECLAF